MYYKKSSVNTGEHLQGSDRVDQQSKGLKAVTQADFHCATSFDARFIHSKLVIWHQKKTKQKNNPFKM